MKRFMKGCGIAALVMIVVGVIMALVVTVTKGTSYMNSFLDNVTDGRINNWFRSIEERGYQIDRYAEGHNDFDGYDINDATMYNKKYPVENGDVEYTYQTFSELNSVNLDVELGGCMFYIEESSDGTFYVEGENTSKFQAYEEGGTVYLKATRKTNVWDEIKKCVITLYIPAGHSFSDVQMDLGAGLMDLGTLYSGSMTLAVGAGQITADFLQAESLDVSVGAGEALIDDMNVTYLNASVGAGHIYAGGSVGGDINAECAMGSLELDLNGAETDFDYSVECMAGAVLIGDSTFAGLASERNWSNGAGRLMNLECSMGQIEVSFWE